MHGRLVDQMDLAEQYRVARDRERQISQMSEKRHARRAVFLEKAPDHAWKYIYHIWPGFARISIAQGYAAGGCHTNYSGVLSRNYECTTRRNASTANQGQLKLAKPMGPTRLGGLLFMCSNPSKMRKSLAFEFYLMRLYLEHIMNKVKKKCEGGLRRRLVAKRRPAATGRRDLPVQLARGCRDDALLDRNAEFPL